MIDPKLEQLFAHLHRGGAWAYYWTAPEKRTAWHQVGRNGTLPKGANIYFGVHPTHARRSNNQRARAVDVCAVNCLFAEFDAKDFGDSKDKTLAHVHGLALTPSVIVDSGGGYHCYWLLDEPYPITGDEDRARIDRIQKAWVAFVCSDNGAKDLARVLRVPGMTNNKYTPPRPVMFHVANFDILYDIDDLEAISFVLPTPEPLASHTAPAAGANHGALEPSAYAKAALNGELARVRSARQSTRNTTLNKAAYAVGRLVGAGALDQTTVERELVDAVLSTGLPEKEALGTIRSGMKAGMAKPRQIPERARLAATAGPDLARAPDKTPAESQDNQLPSIQVNNRELRDISKDAMLALKTTGATFIRGGELVRKITDEKGHASIEPMSESALRGALARAANFFALREKKRQDGESEFVEMPVAPPLDVVRDILSLGTWDFPPIEGVIESPIMRPDGTILRTPGYDAGTRLYYQPGEDLKLADIPAHPLADNINQALDLLYSVVEDFPFENKACRDNAIASIITLIARAMINGPVPIAIFDAPQQGTGKTLLALTLALIATGEMPTVGAAPQDPEEWRKRITAQLSTGKPVIIFDNVTHTLDDGSLASVTSSSVWEDRILGTQKTIRLPQRAVWMVTGNNVRVGGDLVRRCYSIRLDAKMSRPWQREGFKHANLEEWIRENRGALIGAALTLARAWVAVGRPKPTGIRMGGYEAWARVVGGILQFAGAKDFLCNIKEFYETADDDTPAWEAFITKLHDVYGEAETTAGQIFTRFCPDPEQVATEDLAQYVPQELTGLLDIKSKAKFVQRLGYEFKARKGKRYGDAQAMLKPGNGTRYPTWRFYVNKESLEE